jgi:ATP-dependent DNA helicase PIF1
LRLLDAVRLNEIDYEVLEELNERCEPNFQAQDFYITLSSRNAKADAINSAELAKIPMPEERYIATITGEFNPSQYPVEPALRLKLNAQVMFLKNDPERRFVNGSIGKVVKLDIESVTVMLEDNDEERRYVEVQAMDWEVLRYRIDPGDPEKIETEVIGTFRQIPLRLAWAVTIHKAQGKTFDKVIIDKFLNNDVKREKSAERHPLKRVGTSDDMAQMASFLISAKSSWISGQIFHVDGGMSTLLVNQ